jgi:hypothetical protein
MTGVMSLGDETHACFLNLVILHTRYNFFTRVQYSQYSIKGESTMFKKNLFLLFAIGMMIISACGAPQAGGFIPPAQNQPEVSQPAQNPPAENQPAAQNPSPAAISNPALNYPIVDTGQAACYGNSGVTACPQEGQAFAGQDGNYQGIAPAYKDNGDGTVTDLNTGLMWQKTSDFNSDGKINAQDKMSFDNALSYADSFTLAGYNDWRLPTIKELYSLMNFAGRTGSAGPSTSQAPADAVPYLDTKYFDFAYGDGDAGERFIDAQYWSSTRYVGTTMNGNATAFGVNFADGRIKGYGTAARNFRDNRYVRYVRGNAYGVNAFVDNGGGTITDNATGLTWLQQDSGGFKAGTRGDGSLNWQEALAWCESLDYAGASDWRLPNAKELHSIVDYTRSPSTTNSAAIDPLFQATYLPNGVNNNGYANYAHYWSSTTHLDGMPLGSRGVYFAFGRADGLMNGTMMDVHGAGAQRSDQKSGDPSQLPVGMGPQGDVQSIYNYARCVRGGVAAYTSGYMGTESSGGGQMPMGGQGQPPMGGQGQQDGQPPMGGQGGMMGQPPQAAIDACANQSQGAACSFSAPMGTISGTCQTPPNQTQLICVPAGGPPNP